MCPFEANTRWTCGLGVLFAMGPAEVVEYVRQFFVEGVEQSNEVSLRVLPLCRIQTCAILIQEITEWNFIIVVSPVAFTGTMVVPGLVE